MTVRSWALSTLCMSIAVASSTGCIYQSHGKFTALSDRRHTTAGFRPEPGPRVSARDTAHSVGYVFYYQINPGANFDRALQRALDDSDGDLLLDASVSGWTFVIPTYWQRAWRVSGVPVRLVTDPGPAE